MLILAEKDVYIVYIKTLDNQMVVSPSYSKSFHLSKKNLKKNHPHAYGINGCKERNKKENIR